MAPRWQRGLAAAVALAAHASAEPLAKFELQDALGNDDECRVGGDAAACALNELQLRAGKASAEAQAEALEEQVATSRLESSFWFKSGKKHVEARKHPSYCDLEPPPGVAKSPYCLAENSCQCNDCSGVRPEDWQFDPNCCGCSSLAQTSASVTAAGAQLDTSVQNKGGTGHKAPKPVYCQWTTSAYCATVRCGCAAYCHVASPTSYGWDPNCCACGSLLEEAASTEVSRVPPEPRRPQYCAHVASESAAACSAEFASCLCAEHCAAEVPASAWSWDSNCCGCDLELLQVSKTGPLAHPMYCDSMPNDGAASPWCAGTSTCKCEAYCHPSVPPASWGWDPNCCGCASGTAHESPGPAPAPAPELPAPAPEESPTPAPEESPTPAPAPSPAPTPGQTPVVPATDPTPPPSIESNVTQGGLSHPMYCQQLPLGTTSAYCEGASTCGCQAYCTAAVLPSQWGWDPQCCGCGTQEKTIAEEQGETADAPKEGLAHPAYCENLPAGASPFCEGESTCHCKPYCLATVVPGSWRWDPECCGCTESKKTSHDSTSVAPAVPRDQPSYCETLPPFMVTYTPWCAPGLMTCTCQQYCEWSVAPSLWGNDPNCCRCDADSLPVYHPRDKPSYCDTLPPTMRLPWCEGKSTCMCQDYCEQLIAPSRWAWDPMCCGCSSGLSANVKVTATAEAGEKKKTALAQRVAASVPTYCKFLPAGSLPPPCRSGSKTPSGCQCANTCKYLPKAGLQWNPQCCGCH